MPCRTVFEILQNTAAAHGSKLALSQPTHSEGTRQHKTWTWNEHLNSVQEIAMGLVAIGIRKGDVVALCSETRAEFYLADVAIMSIGAIAAALYQSYPAEDLLKTIEASDAAVLFVEDPKMLEQLRRAPVQTFVLLTGTGEGALSLDDLQARGRAMLDADPHAFTARTEAVSSNDYAILYLTSGATGEPKMVLSTHGAVVANVEMGPAAFPLTTDDVTIAFLPSAHITQRIAVELIPMLFGTPVYFSESLLKLPTEIKTIRPTMFVAPPRMWERVYASVCTEIRKKPAAIRKLFYAAVGLGIAASRFKRDGKKVPIYIRFPLKAADKAIFAPIRARLGGRMRIPASGGAPLGQELADFYAAIGMPLVEGYGLTEGGIVTFNPIHCPRSGSIGKLLPGIEMSFAADGELLLKSPCLFSEYYKDAQATEKVRQDGWLLTGDIGYMDSDGFVYITSRKKELIVSSTGKKIFPARVEGLFKSEPLISQVVLIGDRLPYLTALFTINPSIAESLSGVGAVAKKNEELITSQPVSVEVQKIVNRINKHLGDFEKIRKFRILSRDFSIETGELTATMKVRRPKVLENFRNEIDSLYAEKAVEGLAASASGSRR